MFILYYTYRELAHEVAVPWTEYWDFLESYVDLSTDEGLKQLEGHLALQQEEYSGSLLMDYSHDVLDAQDITDFNEYVDTLQGAVGSLELDDIQIQNPAEGDRAPSVPTEQMTDPLSPVSELGLRFSNLRLTSPPAPVSPGSSAEESAKSDKTDYTQADDSVFSEHELSCRLSFDKQQSKTCSCQSEICKNNCLSKENCDRLHNSKVNIMTSEWIATNLGSIHLEKAVIDRPTKTTYAGVDNFVNTGVETVSLPVPGSRVRTLSQSSDCSLESFYTAVESPPPSPGQITPTTSPSKNTDTFMIG